ncbi:protein-L-isoaspartate O-methyltransferase [Gorgonomyces haynaldii]|nr:protein-L-isoaspartate O-methyltransferase [Gorgonomyces haynaldii]
MHAYAVSYMEPYLNKEAKVLDVGSGSGYLTCVLSHLTKKTIGIEHVPQLVQQSRINAQRAGAECLFVEGDGRLGYPQEAPYDCIHVGACFDGHPVALLDQLKAPGMLFIPIGKEEQHIIVYEKDVNGELQTKKVMGVRYVPLTSLDKQLIKSV